MQSHSGEKNLICEFCGKNFATKSGLNYHILQHTNEKPFKCESCEMAFTRKALLLTHIEFEHTNYDNV